MVRGMSDAPHSLEDWARLLETNWSARSRSPRRDRYVATLPPGAGSDTWERQARSDAEVLLWGLEPERIAGWHVLEVGCGVGRLVAPLLERVATYTGFDIAAGMVAEARERLAGVDRARFFVGDGLTVPAEACDRRYDLVLSHAVLIHCPLDVIASLLASAWARLGAGGELRVGLLADHSDLEGIESVEAAAPPHAAAEAIDREEEAAPDPLIDGHYYLGHAFRHADVEPFVRATIDVGPGAQALQIVRPTATTIYVIARRPA